MACASRKLVFPITGWDNSLSGIPTLSEKRILEFYSIKSTTERCLERSYNFSVESYVVPSSVKTNSCKRRYALSLIKVHE